MIHGVNLINVFILFGKFNNYTYLCIILTIKTLIDMKSLTEEHQKALEEINEAIKLGADIWSHPKGARGGKDDQFDNLCEYCGKHSKDGEGNYFQILTSGIIIPNHIKEKIIWDLFNLNLIEGQPQGGFAIGNTCAKKLLGKNLNYYLTGKK